MDFHGLARKELQTLCKKNKIPANMTNIAMADALSALQYVEGLDELTVLSQSQEKIALETPSIPPTVNRTKPRTKDPETARLLTRTRRTTRTTDQENKNVAETPAASTSIRTRQSVRLLEKTVAEFSLKDKARAEPVLVKIDFLDQTVQNHVPDNVQRKKDSDDDDDDKKAKAVEIEPFDVSVTDNDASGEVRRVADKVSKVTDDVDVHADQRKDKIIASQQLNIESVTELDFNNLEADSNQFATKSIAVDVSDPDADEDSYSQKSVLNDAADSNQVASKECATDADGDGAANQQDRLIARADSNQSATKSVIAADARNDDSGSHKCDMDQYQLGIRTTTECVEKELFDISLMEACEDEIPNSNYVKQICISSLENTMKNDCDSGPQPTTESPVSNLHITKDTVKKKNNIVDDDSELKSLNDRSLRQLNKMLRERLQISNKKNNNEGQKITITKTQVGYNPRPALQTLPENQMLAGGGPNNEIKN